MRKSHLIPLSPLFFIILICFTSCKEDEPEIATVSLSSDSRTVNEAAGTIEVEVELNMPAPEDITVDYTLTGTAEALGVGNAADYEILGDAGEVEIEKGESSATIEINIYGDAGFEENETIVITLDEVDNPNVVIGELKEMTITVANDDEQLTATMALATLIANEAEDTLEITVNLDKAAPENTTVKYAIEGTALDSLTAFNDEIPTFYSDYYVNGEAGTLIIPKGQTSAKIQLRIYTDFLFEPDETIILTLTEEGSAAKPGSNAKSTITLQQQDGKAIALLWEQYDDVDMDLFLWAGLDSANLDFFSASNDAGMVPQEEIIFLPSNFTTSFTEDVYFGLSYTYYEGGQSPMTFNVHFADYTDGQLEAEANREIFEATYTSANLNPYEETGENPQIVQTFKVVDGQYIDFSGITVPESGSRVRTTPLNKKIKRTHSGKKVSLMNQ